MKLTLRLADHDTETGQTRTLETGRLTIGRGPENDWVLADPDRTLSKNHCRIDASEGGFMLTDLSTNGVFVSGAAQPIGRGQSCALEDGDTIAIGPYRLQAEIAGAGMSPHPGELGRAEVDAIFLGGTGRPPPIAPAIPEGWAADMPSGGFGPDRRAAPEGWDAPPDPATYAATGLFEQPSTPGARSLPDHPFAAAGSLFATQSEHIPAANTVMRLPDSQVVLPTDWNDVDPMDSISVRPRAPQSPEPSLPYPAPDAALETAPKPASMSWPPALPEEPPPPPTLPADWVLPEPVPPPLPAAWAPDPAMEPRLAPPTEPQSLRVAEPRPEPAMEPLPPPVAALPAPQPVAALPTPPPVAALPTPPPVAATPTRPPVRPVAPASPRPLPKPRPAPAPPPASHAAAPAPVEAAGGQAGAEQLLAAFLDGAGLTLDAVDGADRVTTMREAGQMIRAAIDGVRDIMATRALVKSEFRVDQTVLRRTDNNAVKFAPDVQRCLAAMVGTPPAGFLPGPAAMRQALDDIKAHELALVAALNSVFADLDQRLEPDAIMRRARQDTGISTMLPNAREARSWAIFVETYRLLQESGATNTGGSLLAPLAAAYARQLRRGL